MNAKTLNRRDLNRLALAALGGLVAGALPGCGPTNNPPKDKVVDEKDKDSGSADEASPLFTEKHVCRGINTCKNKGKKGTTNDCTGQGHCALAAAHDCANSNDCKGQGGCGEKPGENQCQGKGSCEVPLKKDTWPKARKRFEELMTKAKKDFGKAPDS